MRIIQTIIFLTMSLTMQAYTLQKDSTKTDSVAVDSVAVDSTAAKKPEKKESEYEKLIKKGGSVQEGLFTVRKIEGKWYFEVPDAMLGRLILCVSRFTAVPQGLGQFAGEEITHSTIYFEQRDTATLFMRQYVLTQFSNEGDNIGMTLQKSTIDPIVMAFKIIGKDSLKTKNLIEVTNLFCQDNSMFNLNDQRRRQLSVGGIMGDRTFVDTMKVFPTNIEVVTTRTYGASSSSNPAAETGSVTMGFNTSMVLLPEEPMRKRIWDERVGYFVNRFTQFTDDQHKSKRESFISRYRLEPKDARAYHAGQLVEPKKQIVYYIDPATPKKWVPYLIAGVNDWNVAFEAAGFKNAIVAKEWPKDRPDMSLDDARFSVIRYLPSETENAYGPHIVDPRSGEIIEAHICWFHNVMNLLTKWYMVQCGPNDKRARTMKFDDELMGQLIRFVSSHEVGHTLGLRHNMGASSATPVEKLRDKKWVEKHGHTSSIMDYARFNYVAQPEDNISEKGLFPRINDYDKWAIKWGYQYRPEFVDEFEEKEKLMTETTKKLRGNPRLWFGGEGYTSDPRAQTEDLGDNSMKASAYGIKNLKRVMEQLPKWTHQDNDQYDDLKEMYSAVSGQYMRYVNHVLRNINGRFYNNMPDREPVENLPVEQQREAMQFLGDQLFDAPEWLYPKNIIGKTGTNAASDQQSLQTSILSQLMSPSSLYGIAFYTDYPVGQYFDDLFSQVWKPLDGNDFKQSSRRQLQRSYLQNLNSLLNPTETELRNMGSRYFNTDVQLYAEQNLGKVEEFCKQQQSASTGIDALHYQDLLRQLKLIRDRRTTVK